MRRLFAVLVLVAMLFASVVPSALADEKPMMVPHMVEPGDAEFAATFGTTSFADLWVALEATPGAGDLPQGDDFLRGGSVGPIMPDWHPALEVFQHGIPIGFNFKFLQGPLEPAPGWPPGFLVDLLRQHGLPLPPPPEDWPAFLGDKGYEALFVSTNGFVTFANPKSDLGGLGTWTYPDEWNGNFLPWRAPPNNFIAPYWTDWVIGDNDYDKVEDVCGHECLKWHYKLVCVEFDAKTGECIKHVEIKDYCLQYDYYVPCRWSVVPRERGKLLYATVGTAPFRRFIVQWRNARHYRTGFLADFELQLFETSNAILFLYNAFDSKGGPYFEGGPVIMGIEDSYGTTGVGLVFQQNYKYVPRKGPMAGIGFWARIPAAFEAGDMVGFVY